MKRHWLLLLAALWCVAPVRAVTILQCNTNGGGWTTSGCATASVFATMSNVLDYGAPILAGSVAAHPLEAGLGVAIGASHTHDVSSSGQWMATGSDGTDIGLGVGPNTGAASQVLIRTDNTIKFYDPSTNGGNGWDFIGSTTNAYYQGWSFFAGHANSAPIDTNPPGSGDFDGAGGITDQFFTGPYFYTHGAPPAGGNSSAVPYVGDHLVGYSSTRQNQDMLLTFDNGSGGGVDAASFAVVARSDTQTDGQATALANWGGLSAAPNGILDILIQAYDNLDPLSGTLLYSYQIEVDGSFGVCTSLSDTTPVPCNDAPVVSLLGTPGLFNIRSIVISTSTDAFGFYIDELHYNQADVEGVPEPGGFLLIGGGLLLVGGLARRRGIFRS